MNLKQKMKNFFTLTRKSNGGFTLVELIVVIAILAILGGVAVPAYSGYVKKANMQADMTLVSDIEHALMLAFYSGALKEDGYVILSDTAPDYGGNTEIEKALQSAFGADLNNLVLKYDSWVSSNSADVISVLQSQGADVAGAVAGSTYADDITQMLADAQDCTNAFADFVQQLITKGDSQKTYDALVANSSSNLVDVLNNAGMLETDDEGNPVTDADGKTSLADPSNTSTTQLSNAMLLAIATEIGDTSDLATAGQSMAMSWLTSSYDDLSLLAQCAAKYAYFESATAVLNDAKLDKAFAEMNVAFDNATSATDVTGAMSNVETLITGLTDVMDDDEYMDYYEKMISEATAFIGVMNAVSQVKDDYSDAATLGQEDLYASDDIASVVNGYVGAAKNFANLPAALSEGEIMVVFSAEAQKVYSLPNV